SFTVCKFNHGFLKYGVCSIIDSREAGAEIYHAQIGAENFNFVHMILEHMGQTHFIQLPAQSVLSVTRSCPNKLHIYRARSSKSAECAHSPKLAQPRFPID